jgi:c-di-AMP phosphodiesterase-like protein
VKGEFEEMQNKRMDFFSKLEELPAKLHVILAIFIMVVHITVCAYTNANEAIVGLLLIAIYIVITIAVRIITGKKLKLLKMEVESSEKHNNGVIYTFQNNLLLPYAVVSATGKIVTSNTAFSNILNTAETVFNRNIEEICNTTLENILKISISSSDIYDQLHTDFDAEDVDVEKPVQKDTVVELHDRKYRLECHHIYVKNEKFYMVLFHDVTEFLALDALHYAEHTALAYIVLDNLDGIAQYAQANYQAEANQVGDILKDWVKSFGGVIREHERNKYIMMCSRKALNKCVATKFEILDAAKECGAFERIGLFSNCKLFVSLKNIP